MSLCAVKHQYLDCVSVIHTYQKIADARVRAWVSGSPNVVPVAGFLDERSSLLSEPRFLLEVETAGDDGSAAPSSPTASTSDQEYSWKSVNIFCINHREQSG